MSDIDFFSVSSFLTLGVGVGGGFFLVSEGCTTLGSSFLPLAF